MAPLKKNQICAVIPACNEAASIRNVLRQLCRAGVSHAVVVANGCMDETPHIAKDAGKSLGLQCVVIDEFERLGPDVPRAVGTFMGLRRFPECTGFLYIDGDWKGNFGPMLSDYLDDGCSGTQDVLWVGSVLPTGGKVTNGQDAIRPAAAIWQAALAETVPTLRDTYPSLLPWLVRRTAFQTISPYWLHHPGKWAAMALLVHGKTLQIRNYPEWEPRLLGNPTRSAHHAAKMTDTLIGDALEGCALLLGRRPTRLWRGVQYDGYHPDRRMDRLAVWQSAAITVSASYTDPPLSKHNKNRA